jgi:circadian clock protein KaiC
MDTPQNSGSARVSSGIEGLDFILKGGLPEHRLYLIQGDPGTGKTTMGMQFLLEGERKGERGLYITLSESRDELISVGRSHGWNLDGLDILDLTVSGDSLTKETGYTVFHPSEVELDETTKTVLREVERVNPARVVFDSLSEMRMLAGDALRFRRQILALKQYFSKRKCTVMLIDDLTSHTSQRQLESIAHGVITLEYVPTEYGKQRHSLRVVKMRGVNFQSGSHDFNIETGGIVVFPRLGSPEVKTTFPAGAVKSKLDDLEQLLGGLDYGTSTILTGPAGIGKSTFALMYALTAAENGERAAIYLFDESVERFTNARPPCGWMSKNTSPKV